MTTEKGISEAVMLAGASALSYAVAHAYNAGYASHFGLPPLLSTPTIGRVLQAGAAVGATLLLLWNVVNAIWMFLPSTESAVGRSIRRFALMTLISGLCFFSFFSSKWGWLGFAVILAFFAFFEFLFPLITGWKVSGYESKLAAQEGIEASVNTLVGRARNSLGSNTFSILLCALVLIVFAHSLGKKSAIEQTDFFVAVDQPGFVVAAMDDDLIVFAAYDAESLSMKGVYKVQHLSGDLGCTLERKLIGRLAGPVRATSAP